MVDLLLARLQTALGDRYALDRRIGQGGMATVFLAKDRKLNKTVALKVLRPELATALGAQRFHREIGIVADLSHPHIVPLLDSDTADGLLFYTMPYVEGDTLRSRLQRERQLPVTEAVRIACDVAEALSYAHSRGVVHRDIKPENIMCWAEHSVVTDFGIARAITAALDQSITETGITLGTPAYMSPEQGHGESVDGRADIYSLGCVLYELLSGSPPFSGPTAQVLIARHSSDPPPPIRTVRDTVPEALESAVLRALAKVPADRFRTAADFKDALAAPAAPADRPDRRSIAVLPFANQCGDAAFNYLSDGVAEEIIIALTQIPGLRVAARTSSFAFRGNELDLPGIGSKLRVATVLEGSVRKSENILRVSARLANVADGFTLWSERYERAMTDVFKIQDDIARAVARGLHVTFKDWEGKPQDKPYVTPPTANLEAYDLYLKGRYQLAQRGPGMKRALDLFQHAARLDPEYALAQAGTAEAYTVLAQYGMVPPNAIRASAQAAVQRALALAPDSAEAHCAAGALSMVCDWDWSQASTELQRAVELAPSYVTARIWLAFYLVFVEGRLEAGIDQAQRAVDLDPLSPLPAMQLGMALLGAGRYDAAATALERAHTLDRTLFVPTVQLGLLYNHLGRTADAMRILEPAIANSGRHPWTLSALAMCHGALGERAAVDALRDELVARARREYVQSSMLAVLTALLGRMDDAFALLERACDEHDGVLVYSKRYPFFKVFQPDPRMEDIFRRVGFAPSP